MVYCIVLVPGVQQLFKIFIDYIPFIATINIGYILCTV